MVRLSTPRSYPSDLAPGRRLPVFLLAVLLFAACGPADEPYTPHEPATSGAFEALERARDAYAQHDVRSALAFSDSAVAAAPGWAPARAFRGEVHLALNQFASAEADLERAQALDPHARGVRYQRGHSAFLQGRYEEALAHYTAERDLLAASPGPVARFYEEADRAALPNLHLQIGRALVLLGRVDEARATYEEALDLDSTRAQAWAWLGELEEEAGDAAAALDHYERALTLEPFNMDYRYETGRLLAQAGRRDEALPLLTGVLRNRPWHSGATYNLGRLLVAEGRPEEARALLARADSLQLVQQELDQALAAAYQQPNNPHRWVELGGLYVQMGRYGEAEEALGAALNLTPDNPAIRNDAANLALARGDTLLALERYRAILALDETNADVWLNLGAVHAMRGAYDEARAAWQTALRHDPDHTEARAYLSRLPGSPRR